MKLWLICYDVTDNRRRYFTDKVLNGYGIRVQYSAFECHLTTSQYLRLRRELEDVTDSTDKIHFFSVCEWCRNHRQSQGTGELTENPDYYGVF